MSFFTRPYDSCNYWIAGMAIDGAVLVVSMGVLLISFILDEYIPNIVLRISGALVLVTAVPVVGCIMTALLFSCHWCCISCNDCLTWVRERRAARASTDGDGVGVKRVEV